MEFISITNEILSCKICLKGAEIQSIQAFEKEYIWQPYNGYWNKQSPLLFPIVGSLINQQFLYQNKTFVMPRHGFARDLNFAVVELSNSYCSLQLIQPQDLDHIYPFQFQLYVHYSLVYDKIKIKFEVKNQGNSDMFFNTGGHPAFGLANPLESYSLYFENTEWLNCATLNKQNLRNSEYIKINLVHNNLQLGEDVFKNDALIIHNQNIPKITLMHLNKPIVTVSNESNLPFWGIWKQPMAPFICIEPWNGLASSTFEDSNIENKEFIIQLPANQVHTSCFSIQVFDSDHVF